MRMIDTTEALAALCAEYAASPYVTVDTEFMRERTYWPQLCLVQIARPGPPEDESAAAIIDPMAAGIDLAPLFELMANEQVVKVFHAARQDVEIFHHLAGAVPRPIFDTQVAAMVCGYGDQVGYEKLVARIVKATLDKSSRFTDWARRPLSAKQLDYALGDVTHLRIIYEALSARLEESGRAHWVAEEMAVLTAPETYEMDPVNAWKRLKTRSSNGRFLAAVRTLAEWRETLAQERDVPRGRIIKDDALLEVASSRPKTIEELGRSRLVHREARRPETAEGLLAALRAADASGPVEVERQERSRGPSQHAQGLGELLRVLLKAKSERLGVAPRLLASSADLDALAQEDAPDVAALAGWRREAFGEDALRLKRGEIALSASTRGVEVIETKPRGD